QDLARLFHVSPLQAHHHRHFEADLAARFHQRLGDQVTLGDAAEDVHQDTLDLRVLEDDAKRLDRSLRGNTATDVEEVCRIAAVILDDVHCAHCQAGAIDQAADVAAEADEIQ